MTPLRLTRRRSRSMDAKDVLGDGCEQMLAAANSKRHAELITRVKELVVGLEEGRFVASTPLDADAGGGNEIAGEDGRRGVSVGCRRRTVEVVAQRLAAVDLGRPASVHAALQ